MRATQALQSRGLAMVALLATIVMFTGCVEVEFTSEFQRDGIAIHTLAVTIPREEYRAAEEAGQTEVFDEISENASNAGLQASRIVTDDAVTFRVSTERPDGEDAGAALNSLLNATGINDSPGISAPFSGYFRQEGSAVGGNNFVLDIDIDGAQLYDAASTSDVAAGYARSEVEEDVSISYDVLVPGDLIDSTGQEIEPGVVHWDITPNTIISTKTETSAGDSSRAALFVTAGVIALIGVVGVALVIGLILVRRPRLATSISSAAGHFPRQTTITREGLWVSARIRKVVERIWHRGAPDRELPVRADLLDADLEEDEDGADTKGDRPATGVHSG